MTIALTSLTWEPHQLAALVTALGRRAGLILANAGAGYEAGSPEAVCAARGLDAEPEELVGETLEGQLHDLAPGLVQMPDGGYLGVLAGRGATVQVLTPRLTVVRVPLAVCAAALRSPAIARVHDEIDPLLDGCHIPARRRSRAVTALVREHLRQTRLGTAWQIRVPPGAPFGWQCRHAGLLRRLLTCLGAHLAAFLVLLAAWQMLGASVLRGRLETGWVLGWMALLATGMPLRLLATWSQGVLAIGLGGLLKQRLLSGALRFDTDTIRQHGVGELLGRVIEAESLEALALSGGLPTVLALGELAIVVGLMHWGAAPLWQPLLLGAWLVLLGWGAYIYGRRRQRWTTWRQHLTGLLVERLTGHRTRLAQQPPEHWHVDEDLALEQYLALSADLDRASVWLTALLTRGWLLVGVLTLVPAYMATVVEPARLAVSLGCLLLGHQALRRVAGGITQLIGAVLAWRQVAPLFHAAAHVPAPGVLPDMAPHQAATTVLEAHDLVVRYPGRQATVLRECSLMRLRRGDSVLLEGNSGGGKSTLVAVLSGLRLPESGVLLAGGLDRTTLGQAGWQRRIVAAPQYHENHILSAPLAFNLLLGRRWPPTPADLQDAEEVCRGLGLGALLERMPGGLMQMVGDTGWQLSHGERSRVYMARALLQGGEVLLLDESFAALDPPTLQQCLTYTLRRAPTVLVVAHP